LFFYADICIKKDLFDVLTALYWFNQKTCAQRFWGNGSNCQNM